MGELEALLVQPGRLVDICYMKSGDDLFMLLSYIELYCL